MTFDKEVIIGLIVKDEFPYILEWVAYYRTIGLRELVICDNASTDGTAGLLEALEDAGVIKRFFQPNHENSSPRGPQLDFYARLIDQFSSANDLWILFIDVDEFLYSPVGDEPAEVLRRLTSDPKAGAIAINWHLFGIGPPDMDELVTSRITVASELEHPRNRTIKSCVRSDRVTRMNCHHADLFSGAYIDDRGACVEFANGEPGPNTAAASASALRIAHYIVKSRAEFFERKRKRGRAGVGVQSTARLRPEDFIERFAVFDKRCFVLAEFSGDVREEIDSLIGLLKSAKTKIGNTNSVSIWLESSGIYVSVSEVSVVERNSLDLTIRLDCQSEIRVQASSNGHADGLVTFKAPLRGELKQRMSNSKVAHAWVRGSDMVPVQVR